MHPDLDLQPTLAGDLVRARPLERGDFDALYAVASDPLLWEQHPDRERWREERFRQFFDDAMASRGALIVLDAATGRVIGSSRYRWFGDGPPELEIGWTFLARSHWGGSYNGELKRLMLAHAFTVVDHVVFFAGAANERSRRALARVGATFQGELELVSGRKSVRFVLERPAAPAP